MYCEKCGKELDDDVRFCKYCGTEFTQKQMSVDNNGINNVPQNNYSLGNIIGSVILFGLIWWGFDAFFWNIDSPNFDNKYAQEMVEQYEIAKNQGDRMEKCMQAGAVAQAFLQAKNQDNYNKWKIIESTDCRAAGLNY